LKLGPGAVTSGAIASGQVVKSLNALADTVTIAGSGGATVSTAGSTITVAAAAAPTPGTVVVGVVGDTTLIGAGHTQIGGANQDFWTPTATTAGVPTGRSDHTAVWTGTRMIVWGGVGPMFVNTGGQYDPVGYSWAATATTAGVPSARYVHTAVWTGSKMIVWGGYGETYANTGGQWFGLSYFVKN